MASAALQKCYLCGRQWAATLPAPVGGGGCQQLIKPLHVVEKPPLLSDKFQGVGKGQVKTPVNELVANWRCWIPQHCKNVVTQGNNSGKLHKM